MWPNAHGIADLVTFTEVVLNGKLHFLCSDQSHWPYFNALGFPSKVVHVFILSPGALVRDGIWKSAREIHSAPWC